MVEDGEAQEDTCVFVLFYSCVVLCDTFSLLFLFSHKTVLKLTHKCLAHIRRYKLRLYKSGKCTENKTILSLKSKKYKRKYKYKVYYLKINE